MIDWHSASVDKSARPNGEANLQKKEKRHSQVAKCAHELRARAARAVRAHSRAFAAAPNTDDDVMGAGHITRKTPGEQRSREWARRQSRPTPPHVFFWGDALKGQIPPKTAAVDAGSATAAEPRSRRKRRRQRGTGRGQPDGARKHPRGGFAPRRQNT